ncbi:hypothetical protein LEP1GSC202_2605 [Leptospira yanagawae serovar Saopaulo str. Sao Paulo = ATCC 700523]|uniref:Uncharacterized protein n=1 Tax=Leptospira yanagawae serovar Saopaulo str. Sao Paulo = ATCC 700523 TaxID=1249483 RepID=A0A5E8H6X3_9LEPT|nr:hypothetical protein LEP1GSC202_2605 [Leptospira yanagawae serovar Saopaulo str. Sao Paulo = ATCC 700523]
MRLDVFGWKFAMGDKYALRANDLRGKIFSYGKDSLGKNFFGT